MRRRRIAAATALIAALALTALPSLAWSPAEEYEKAVKTIRCDCGCHPQSVEDCACGRAEQMRAEMAALVDGSPGKPAMTGDEIIASYIAEKGEQILIAPAAAGFNLFAWLGPVIGLVLGLFGALALVRNLSRRPAEEQPVVATPTSGEGTLRADDPYRARLQKQLDEEWD